MPSKLEAEILIPRELLSVVGVELRPDTIVIDLASWDDPPGKRGRLSFSRSKLKSVFVTYDENEKKEEPSLLDFPWDFYGFDSDSLEKGRWRFILCSHVLEIAFEADWPLITDF